eukprot:RCo038104
MAAILKKTWSATTWIPKGLFKALGNELSSFGQVFAPQEALARVAKLESEGKNPLQVARTEYINMWLASQPYRLRTSIVEWEKLKANVFSGKIDLQDLIELLYMLFWAYLLYKLGESVGRGSFYGYRFNGEIHHAEAKNVVEYKKKEAEEAEKMFAQLEKDMAVWMAKLEADAAAEAAAAAK